MQELTIIDALKYWPELLKLITAFLDVTSLCRLARVSSYFYKEIIRNNGLWTERWKNEFTTDIFGIGDCLTEIPPNPGKVCDSYWNYVSAYFWRIDKRKTQYIPLVKKRRKTQYIPTVKRRASHVQHGVDSELINHADRLVTDAAVCLVKARGIEMYKVVPTALKDSMSPLYQSAKNKFDQAIELVRIMTVEERECFRILQIRNVRFNTFDQLISKKDYELEMNARLSRV